MPRPQAVADDAEIKPGPNATERRPTGVKVLSEKDKQALAEACLAAGGTGRACEQLGR